MTTDTEALRAQFERRMNQRGWSEANLRRDGLDYSSTQITEAWHAFQAGHAAATAETAAAVAGRWYFVTNDGAATLCVDEADARGSATEADIAFPRMAPHRAVQLVPADQLAAAVAKERERIRGVCLEIADRYWTKCQNNPVGNVQRLSGISDGASYCADAIRAGAKEPSNG